MNPHDNPEGFLAILAAIGALVGIGKLLAASEPITLRLFLGRAIATAGIGAAAGGLMFLAPEAPSILLYGAAAGLASIGTSTLEYILKKRLGGPGNE